MSKSTLSSVVSNLVRASMGSSVSDGVPDEDLDRHVAELILKEAKQKAERYGSEGYKAYLPQSSWSESNAPRTNKRFLSSIIKNTDEHNKTILRAQALAAQEVRMERLEQEKRERRARAEEAAEAERIRRLMGKGGTERSKKGDRDERRDGKKRERSWERRDSYEDDEREDRKGKGKERKDSRRDRDERRRRYRSRSPVDEEEEYERSRRHRSHRERSRSPRTSAHSEDEDAERRRRHRESRSKRSRSRDRDRDRDRHRSHRDDTERRERHRRHRESRRRPRSPASEHSNEDEDTMTGSSRRKRSLTPSSNTGRTRVDGSLEKASGKRESSSESPRKRPRSSSPTHPPSRSPTPGPLPAVEESALDEHSDKSPTQETEEDILRRQFNDRVAELRANLSKRPRTTSSKHNGSAAGSSSSRTHRSPRTSSTSPGPRPPSPESSSRSKRKRHKAKDAPPPPSTPPPPLPAHLPSKMDKYFDESYDPRLDVAPLTLPTVPANGLIPDADFEGWDAMLEIIRRRREDKEDKKRLERMGIGKDTSKDSKKTLASTSDVADIMSIEYKKRGAVREWDLGKEGF